MDTKLKYGPNSVTMSEVWFWDIATGEHIADYHGDEDYGFGYGALSGDGRHVAVGDFSLLRILDAATGLVERKIELPGSWCAGRRSRPMGGSSPCRSTMQSGSSKSRPGGRLHHDESTPVGNVVSAGVVGDGRSARHQS